MNIMRFIQNMKKTIKKVERFEKESEHQSLMFGRMMSDRSLADRT
ncbi:hypothetical protein [Desulfonatronum parangueonense]